MLQRRPFQALAAVQNASVDPTGHVVDVLFTSDVDPAALVPGDPRKFTIPGKVSNGGSVQAEMDVTDGAGSTVSNPFAGLRNTRIVRVVFNNPLSPYAPQEMTVSGVKDLSGAAASSTTLRVRTTATDPGIQVAGKVYGSDGQPTPFALVELRESDLCLFCADTCSTHKTAAVQADAGRQFPFRLRPPDRLQRRLSAQGDRSDLAGERHGDGTGAADRPAGAARRGDARPGHDQRPRHL